MKRHFFIHVTLLTLLMAGCAVDSNIDSATATLETASDVDTPQENHAPAQFCQTGGIPGLTCSHSGPLFPPPTPPIFAKNTVSATMTCTLFSSLDGPRLGDPINFRQSNRGTGVTGMGTSANNPWLTFSFWGETKTVTWVPNTSTITDYRYWAYALWFDANGDDCVDQRSASVDYDVAECLTDADCVVPPTPRVATVLEPYCYRPDPNLPGHCAKYSTL